MVTQYFDFGKKGRLAMNIYLYDNGQYHETEEYGDVVCEGRGIASWDGCYWKIALYDSDGFIYREIPDYEEQPSSIESRNIAYYKDRIAKERGARLGVIRSLNTLVAMLEALDD